LSSSSSFQWQSSCVCEFWFPTRWKWKERKTMQRWKMVFSDLRSLLRFFWLVAFALLMLLKEKGPYLPLLVDRMLTRVLFWKKWLIDWTMEWGLAHSLTCSCVECVWLCLTVYSILIWENKHQTTSIFIKTDINIYTQHRFLKNQC